MNADKKGFEANKLSRIDNPSINDDGYERVVLIENGEKDKHVSNQQNVVNTSYQPIVANDQNIDDEKGFAVQNTRRTAHPQVEIQKSVFHNFFIKKSKQGAEFR